MENVLGSSPSSAAVQLCARGQLPFLLWALFSSSVKITEWSLSFPLALIIWESIKLGWLRTLIIRTVPHGASSSLLTFKIKPKWIFQIGSCSAEEGGTLMGSVGTVVWDHPEDSVWWWDADHLHGWWLQPEISVHAEWPMGCICAGSFYPCPWWTRRALFIVSVMLEDTQYPYHAAEFKWLP